MSDPIVILGTGPSGLACAYKILKESQKKVLLIDKASVVGGLGASFKWKGYILDYGPHAFHARGGEPEILVRSLFKDDPDILVEGEKNVYVYLKGKTFKYPLQVREVLLKFNPFLSIKMAISFFLTSIFHAIVSIPINNFEDWGRKRFGSTLYKISFGDYTEKMWKTKPQKISEKFAEEKIQGFNFINLVKRLLKIGGQVTEPYFQRWIYHKYGSGQLYNRLAEQILKLRGKILLNTRIKSINIRNHKIDSITIEREGMLENIPCGYLVSSIPLNQLISLFDNELPFIIRHAASKLSWISLIIVYIEFDIEKVSDCHWFYLLDKKFKFNRVTEQKNISAATINNSKAVLSFELSCQEGDDIWKLSDEELFDLAKDECKNIHFIPMDQIRDFTVRRISVAYEVYYKHFDQYAELLFSYLKEFGNIVSIGRRGLFLQGDMHQSMEMGLEMGEILNKGTLDNMAIKKFQKKYVKYLDY